jgi:hypothetical protein
MFQALMVGTNDDDAAHATHVVLVTSRCVWRWLPVVGYESVSGGVCVDRMCIRLCASLRAYLENFSVLTYLKLMIR